MWKKISIAVYNSNMESRDEYLDRMKDCRQFKHFGIEPKWHPGEGDVDGFIHDEVVRQFHDTRISEDGGRRVQQMRQAWGYAKARDIQKPGLSDILHVGHLVEPRDNPPGRFRGVNVFIGTHEPPRHQDVPSHMASLASSIPDVKNCDENCGGDNGRTNYYETSGYGHPHPTPDDWYLQFESIHPFADGNGRSGKILRSWMKGNLDNPDLVPDYFNGGNP